MTQRQLLIGIDEAGYGPNLGPFVTCLTAFETPANLCHDLWPALNQGIRRVSEGKDKRAIVDDSKLVHRAGLAQLERNVLAFFDESQSQDSASLVKSMASNHLESKVSNSPWYQKIPSHLPVAAKSQDIAHTRNLLRTLFAEQEIRPLPAKIAMWDAQPFNSIVNSANNKGAILENGFTQLFSKIDLTEYERVSIVVDRHGGRRFYSSLLHKAFPNYEITTTKEEADDSCYILRSGAKSILSIQFAVRGDQKSLLVALASMIAKYVREIMMIGFNSYFSDLVPGIKPTAGYPLDAKRFYGQVEAILPKIGIRHNEIWRMR